jgi:hypothetical protein
MAASRADAAELPVPFRMQAVGGARFHPRGEAFVQPQVVPPRHGDQIAEPLVRDFVRGHQEGGFLVGLGGGARVEQHRVFESEDGAPVFHRAKDWLRPGAAMLSSLAAGT